MKVLVACEFSGIVRDAFISKGHDAMSCDLIPTIRPGPHYTGDARDLLGKGWDMMICHPPCTHLASSGCQWFKYNRLLGMQQAAYQFVRDLITAPICKICLENPIGVISTMWRKPNQIIQPYEYGHPFKKSTCLWLIGLPKLVPTNIVTPTHGSYAKDWVRDQKKRSLTFQGIADAMADQWS